MLRTSGSIESITRLGKGGVRVSSDGNKNGNHDDGSGCNGDFDKKFYPRLQYNSRTTYFDAHNKLINGLIN